MMARRQSRAGGDLIFQWDVDAAPQGWLGLRNREEAERHLLAAIEALEADGVH